MTPRFVAAIQSDLDQVDKIIDKAFKIRAGSLKQFAHIDYRPLEKNLRPALVILTSRVYGNSGAQVISLAGIIQFIYMASAVHFRISDLDQNLEDPDIDLKDGSQIPVLVGDYLYGKFFTALCAGNLLEFLDPLARVIGEINLGGMLRKQHPYINPDSDISLNIIQKETASLFAGACRLSAMLAKVDDSAVMKASDFGLNLGMAYGIMERKGSLEEAGCYLDQALANLNQMPASADRELLAELVADLKNKPSMVPERILGEEVNKVVNDAIAPSNHEKKVQNMFDSIAKKYDLMNTLLSFGRHHYWRKFTVEKTHLSEGGQALDVCCGTGMITMDLAKKAGPKGKVTGLDFSENMLAIAENRLQTFPLKENITLIQGNAMDLPFPDNSFDCVTIGYGLRNVPDLKKTLAELIRVVKPGGRVVSLEFAKPYLPVFKQLYYFYNEIWVPFMGKINAKNRDAYQYLNESIRSYPHQDKVTEIYKEMGYEKPECYPLTGGIVAVHVGTKPLTK